MGDLILVKPASGISLFPEVKLRAAFGQNAFAASPTWTDISSYLLALDTFHGRNYETDDFDPGEGIFTLRNFNGEFYPNNTGSPFSPNVLPVVRLHCYVIWNLSTYHIFTGFVKNWGHGFLLDGGYAPTVEVQAIDLFGRLGRLRLNDGTGYSEEAADVRLDNLFDDLGWPAALRDFAAAQSDMQATGALSDVNALSHLQQVVRSEYGQAWVAGDGDPQFQDRHARWKSPYLTSQMTFAYSPAAGEFPYQGIEFQYDDQYIYNDIRITRVGGTTQVASDATSQGDYGKSTFPLDVLVTTDGEALDQANYRLSLYKNPAFRINSITTNPRKVPDTLWPKVLSRDISDRITVKYSPASINADYFVEGIRHKADTKSQQWDTTLRLSPAAAQAFWLAGIAGYSEAGVTTRPGY